MSFLAPLWLLLGAAAAVPLLIHLLRRRLGARVEFPAARYLARAEQEHSRRLRLRNLLLMLLRVVAVILLAAAAARPVGKVGGTGHAPTALAIILDNSLSSSAIAGGRPVLAELREAARAIVAEAGDADRLWLVTAEGRVQGGTPGMVLDAIETTEPLPGAGDMGAAAVRGAALVRGSGLSEQRVAIVTDAQASAWPDVVELGEVDVVIYAAAATPPPNRAVTEATARPVRWTPRGSVAAVIASPDSVTYRVTLGDRTLARGTAAPSPGAGGAEIVVRASPAERGWLAGAVEIAPDEMRADDVRHFAAWVGVPPGVALDPAAGPFARSAIEAMQAGGLVTQGTGVNVVSAESLRELPALIIAPADPVRAGAANRALERARIPWRFGPVVRADASARGAGLDGITVSQRLRLAPEGRLPADTLARIGTEPWIVAGPGYVIIASPLDPQFTTLPARAQFVPWMTEVVTQRLAADAGMTVHAAPGDTVARPPWAEALEMPDANRVVLGGTSFEAPSRPGVYFLLRAGRRSGALVVSAEAGESALARLDPDILRERLRARETRVHAGSDGWTATAFAGATRRPLLVPALVAVLLLLVAESAVAAYGMRPTR